MRGRMAQEFAQVIEQAHDIKTTMESAEERALLQQNNNKLYYSYLWLLQIAYPDDVRWNT